MAVDWDAILSDEKPNELEKLAERYVVLGHRVDEAKAEMAQIEEEFLKNSPIPPAATSGEVILPAGKRFVHITVPEKWEWDQDQLRAVVGAGAALPGFVTEQIKVSKVKFEAASPAVQADWLDALTRKPGKPKFKITEAA